MRMMNLGGTEDGRHEYKIVAMSETLGFRPEDYGIVPEGRSSACWAGFWCEYMISEDGIFLEGLFINAKDDCYPKINGIAPLGDGKINRYMGHRYYKGLNIKMSYSGKIVVGKDFLREYYIHMGYQRPWAYKELKEFVFERGNLIDVIDHSQMAEKLREQADGFDGTNRFTEEGVKAFIKSSFDLSLEEKAWWIER